MSKMTSEELERAKAKLTPDQVNVCFLKGTEPPFSGKYVNNHQKGIYRCAVCEDELFSSEAKFDSNSGWPSFDSLTDNSVELTDDFSMGMHRTEVTCKNCGSHLGHVFNDGPTATGKRFCINSLSLNFVPF